ncbi:MAG: TlpA family protein disulfide reductase, partial [Saprospiraceae bacterium]|nr:TlpA family protein disulfide reductase [Saprospiraceae bacterium]
KALPDSVLSPRYYIEKGFNFIPPKPLEPKPESISEPLRDQKFANLLVKSPLILPTGDTTMLERLDSSLLLIDFWYMSCPPCIKAMPYLQNLEKKYGPRGLKLIGINCQDIENKASVARKLNEIGIQYTNYFIEKVYSKTLDIKGYPTMILLNKNREVIASGLGRIENLEFLIEKELK